MVKKTHEFRFKRKKPHSVTIIIPTLNEEGTISQIIQACRFYAKKWIKNVKILVIDGNSTDNTVLKAKKEGALVFKQKGKGLGNAIRSGVHHVRNDAIIIFGADGNQHPKEIELLIQGLRNDVDLVVGSRFKGTYQTSAPWRKLGNQIFNIIARLMFGVPISDGLNGVKMLRRDFAQSLDLKHDGISIDMEICIKTHKKGGKIREVPSFFHLRNYGTSKVSPLKAGMVILTLMTRLFLVE
ncbi:MAG: glycosyltransferase family 2 protein [Candidatus Hodarchaeota archaeon]